MISRYYRSFCAAVAGLFLSATGVMAFDAGTIEAIFSGSTADLESFILAILGVLAVMWVGRKFIALTNHS